MDVPEIGGSYRRDPKSGELTRVEGAPPDEATGAAEPAPPAEPAAESTHEPIRDQE